MTNSNTVDEIIDLPKQEVTPRYLNAAARLLHIYGVAVVASLLYVIVGAARNVSPTPYNDYVSFASTLSFIAMIVLSPIGLVLIWRSWRKGEGQFSRRVLYGIGHTIGFVFSVVIVSIFVHDVTTLF